MKCFTKEECKGWLAGRARELPPSSAEPHSVTFWYPPNPADMAFVWLANESSYREPTLLWITEWGIWPSSENWHLYYRLRQSYGENQLLHTAPGHYFQNFEMDDLASFLQVSVTNGWGGYILPASTHGPTAFFSHDEYIDSSGVSKFILPDLYKRFGGLEEPPSAFHTSGTRQRVTEAGVELGPANVHPTEESD